MLLRAEELRAAELRKITGAPCYMRTRDIELDLNVTKIGDTIQEIAEKYNDRLESHPNPIRLARRLSIAAQSHRTSTRRRLKRHHPQHLTDLNLTEIKS